MNNFIFYIISFSTVFINNYIIIDFFCNRYEKKFKSIIYIVYLFSISIVIFLVNQINNPYLNYVINIINFVLLGIIFSCTKTKDFLINFSFFIVLILLDLILFVAIDTILSWADINQRLSSSRRIAGMVLECMIYFIAYEFIKRYFFEKNSIDLKKKDIFIYFIISILSWIFCLGLNVFSIHYLNQYLYLVTLFSSIMIFIFNILYIYLLKTVSKNNQLEKNILLMNEKSEITHKYYLHLEEKEKENALFLHDIKNHIQTLQNMINTNVNSKYMNNYFESINNILKSNQKSFHSDNKVLEILINDKINKAKEKGIKVDIKFDDSDISFISEFDLVSILSNLFDNAIDATKNITSHDKTISLIIRTINSYLIIKMSNPYENKLCFTNNTLKSTKNDHSGLGLLSLKNSLANYNAKYKIDLSKKDYFIVYCLFYLN